MKSTIKRKPSASTQGPNAVSGTFTGGAIPAQKAQRLEAALKNLPAFAGKAPSIRVNSITTPGQPAKIRVLFALDSLAAAKDVNAFLKEQGLANKGSFTSVGPSLGGEREFPIRLDQDGVEYRLQLDDQQGQ